MLYGWELLRASMWVEEQIWTLIIELNQFTREGEKPTNGFDVEDL